MLGLKGSRSGSAPLARIVRGLISAVPDMQIDGVASGGDKNLYLPVPGRVTLKDNFLVPGRVFVPLVHGGLPGYENTVPDNATKLESGQPWRVWGGAVTVPVAGIGGVTGGVRFTNTMPPYPPGSIMEISVDLPSSDHEIEARVVVPPTVAAYMVARHEIDDPGGGSSVLVEYHAWDSSLQWVANGVHVPIAGAYTAQIGDRWRLILEGALATFIVERTNNPGYTTAFFPWGYEVQDAARATLDLSAAPYAAALNTSWRRVAIAGFDTDQVWGAFRARTIVAAHSLTIAGYVQRPYLMWAGFGMYGAMSRRDAKDAGVIFYHTNNALNSQLLAYRWTGPAYGTGLPLTAPLSYYENTLVPTKLIVTPALMTIRVAGVSPANVQGPMRPNTDFIDWEPFFVTKNPNGGVAFGNRYDCYFKKVCFTRDNELHFSHCFPLGSLRVVLTDSVATSAPVDVPVALDGTATLELTDKLFPLRARVELRDATGKRYAVAVLRNVYGGDHYKGRS